MLVCWARWWSVQVARWPQVQPNSSQVLTQREMPELLCRLSSFLAWILGNCNAEHREAQLGFPACNTICSTHTKVKKKNWNRMEKYPPMLLSGVGSSLELTTWKCPLRSEDKNLCTYKPEYLIKSSFQMGAFCDKILPRTRYLYSFILYSFRNATGWSSAASFCCTVPNLLFSSSESLGLVDTHKAIS